LGARPRAVLALSLFDAARAAARAAVAGALAGAFALSTPAFAITSSQISLRAHVQDVEGAWNDCWGYRDPTTGIEYAIVGNVNGTAIYDLSDPYNPRRTGFIGGPVSTWRAFKTLGTHLYVTTEGNGEMAGLQIVDLADPEDPALAGTYTATFQTAHNLFVDTTTARCYVAGPNTGNGGLRILDLTDPVNPVSIGSYSDEYCHDVYVRGDTAYCSAIFAGKLILLDVSNPADVDTIGIVTYPTAFTHTASPTEDGDYCFTCDEGTGGHVRVWDITDPSAMIEVGSYTANPSASVHNAYVRGNQLFCSYYTEGLRVLDITDPTTPIEKGYYDEHDGGGLIDGAWGVYPFLPSSTIVVSDISSGGWLFALDWEKGKVTGTVRNASTLAGIPGAAVRVAENGWMATADAAGAYLLSLEAGTYTLVAKAFGYADSAVAMVTAAPGSPTTMNLDLSAAPTGTVAGVVREALSGAPLASIWVSVDGTPLGDSTDAGGAYSLPGVPAGARTLRIDAFAWAPDSLAVVVPGGGTATRDRHLEPCLYANEFEDSLGWSSWTSGDGATAGRWVICNPRPTGGAVVQTGLDHSPGDSTGHKRCWATGQSAIGVPVSANDVDAGRTTITSPVFDLAAAPNAIVEYWRWYVNDAGASPGADVWRAEVSTNGGTSWTALEATTVSEPSWARKRVRIADVVPPTAQVRFRFVAEDAGPESIVEAFVDDFRLWGNTLTFVDAPEDPVNPETPHTAASSALILRQNAPNPWNARTEISFDLPRPASTSLRVFTLEGRLVATLLDAALPSGPHRVAWDGRDFRGIPVAEGIYLYRVDTGRESAARRTMRIRAR